MQIITARRMTSGELLKYRKGLGISERHETLQSGSRQFAFTAPSLGYKPQAPEAILPRPAGLPYATLQDARQGDHNHRTLT
jgi:hypothetical protein